jgi:hypothetical protein
MSLRHALVSLSVLPILIFSMLPIPAPCGVLAAHAVTCVVQAAHRQA